jgi:predicted small lipoprotein YifL
VQSFRSGLLSGLLLVLLPCLAACGAEGPPRLTVDGPRPAKIAPQEERPESSGATLAATGRQSFEGQAAYRCVLHEAEGLQVNFRTSDSEMPAVAVRIEDLQGSGPYRARLFVTGRSRTGALVTSTGEAQVEVKRRDLPGASGGASGSATALLSGSFEGEYGGQAGKGSIEGRFGTCNYLAYRGGSPSSASPAGAP